MIITGNAMAILGTWPDETVDAIITDPPYGLRYVSTRPVDEADYKPMIAGDRYPCIWWLGDAYRVTRPGGCLLCFCNWKTQETWRMAIECAGYTIRSHVIWDRVWHGTGNVKGSFAPQHDIIWFAVKGAYVLPNTRPNDVMRVKRIGWPEHPNEKPVELMRQLVRAVTREGDTILDPFCGTGSTLVAAKLEHRRYTGIEIDPVWAEYATNRLQEPSMWDECGIPDADQVA